PSTVRGIPRRAGAGRVLYGYRPSARGWQIFSDFPGRQFGAGTPGPFCMATGHPQGAANIVGFSLRASGAGKPWAGRVSYGYRPSVRGWQIFSDFPGPNPDDGVGFWLPTGGPRRNPPGGGESKSVRKARPMS